MKRFLKHDRYKLSDWETENVWQAIRKDTRSGTRPRRTAPRALRPVLATVATVATLAVLGVWWIDSNQADKIQTAHSGLLAEGPQETSPQIEAPPLKPAARSVESKGPEPQVPANTEMSAVRQEKQTPKGVPVADLAMEESLTMDAAPAGVSLTGRIIDQETGEGLAYASVLIRGTTRGVAADTSGVFRLENLAPGQDITLVVMMLGYAPFEQVVSVPDEGPFEYAFNLEPKIVETLQPFDVAGAEYMVEVKSAVTEHKVDSETFQKYSIQSVDDALSKQAGVVSRAGELYVRGGRSGETSMKAEGVAPLPSPSKDIPMGAGSVTGGTKPPNGEQVELMYFEHTGVNPFVATEDDSLSTFAVDVDNASWTVARNYLSR